MFAITTELQASAVARRAVVGWTKQFLEAFERINYLGKSGAYFTDDRLSHCRETTQCAMTMCYDS